MTPRPRECDVGVRDRDDRRSEVAVQGEVREPPFLDLPVDFTGKSRRQLIGNWDEVRGLESFRVGYVAAPKEKAAKLRSWKQALSICEVFRTVENPVQLFVLFPIEENPRRQPLQEPEAVA